MQDRKQLFILVELSWDVRGYTATVLADPHILVAIAIYDFYTHV